MQGRRSCTDEGKNDSDGVGSKEAVGNGGVRRHCTKVEASGGSLVREVLARIQDPAAGRERLRACKPEVVIVGEVASRDGDEALDRRSGTYVVWEVYSREVSSAVEGEVVKEAEI